MSLVGWLTNLKPARHRKGSPAKRLTPAGRFCPTLEALEDRRLPSTLTVLNNADSGSGSLRAAIDAAQSGDLINFSPNVNGQSITLTSGELAINKNLDIEGPGAAQLIISGNGASRVFDVTSQSASVTIAGLTIENGNTTADGGGIENRGSLTVANCRFSFNSASGNGAGIDNRNALVLMGSNFSFNFADGNGGAIENRGTATVTTMTSFADNAQYRAGGIDNLGSLTLANSNFSNDGGLSAGAIANLGTATVEESTFYDGVGSFGGVYNQGNLTLVGSTFSENDNVDLQNVGTATVSACTIGSINNFGDLSITNQSQIFVIYNAGTLSVSADSTVDGYASYPL